MYFLHGKRDDERNNHTNTFMGANGGKGKAIW